MGLVGGEGSVGTGKVGVKGWVGIVGAFVGEFVLVANGVLVDGRTVVDKVGVIIDGLAVGDSPRSSTGTYSSPKMRLGGISTG